MYLDFHILINFSIYILMMFILIYISHKKTTPKPGYVLYYKRYLSFIR